MTWINSTDEMPVPSKENKYFSDYIFFLVGNRKYRGSYNFHFDRWCKFNPFTGQQAYWDKYQVHKWMHIK